MKLFLLILDAMVPPVIKKDKALSHQGRYVCGQLLFGKALELSF